MANQVILDKSILTDIGNAIRAKEGSTEPIPSVQMASRITNLPSGGDEPTPAEYKYMEFEEPISYRINNRPSFWPDVRLPSQMASEESGDCIEILYEKNIDGTISGSYTLTYNANTEIHIYKYMNKTLVKEEPVLKFTATGGGYLGGHHWSYESSDDDWDSYNYILVRIKNNITRFDIGYGYIEKDFTKQLSSSSTSALSYGHKQILEISGKCASCSVGVTSYQSYDYHYMSGLKYFSFTGISNTWFPTLSSAYFLANDGSWSSSSSSKRMWECTGLECIAEISFNNQLSRVDGFFQGLSSLVAVNLSDIPLTNCTSAVGLFASWNRDKIPNIDTSNYTNVSYMFYNSSIEYVPDFNFRNVTICNNMFNGCKYIKNVNFPIINSTSFKSLFNGCQSLKSVYFYPDAIYENATDISYMFYGCKKLSKIKLPEFPNATNVSYMFHTCGIESFDYPYESASNFTNCQYMFYKSTNINSVNIPHLNPVDASYMLGSDSSNIIEILNVNISMSKWNRVEKLLYFSNYVHIASVDSSDILELSAPYLTTIQNAFYGLPFKNIILKDLSSLTIMTQLCYGSTSIEYIELSGLEDRTFALASAFYGCSKLKEVVFKGNFNALKVSSVTNAFQNCSSLEFLPELDLSSSSITSFSNMANGTRLRNIDLDISRLTVTSTSPISSMLALVAGTVLEYVRFDFTNINVDIQSSLFGNNGIRIEDVDFINLHTSITLSGQGINLSRKAIISLFESLPVITSTKKITLGSYNITRNNISEDDIAIATSKGWTVA